jgi:lipopolysaccharide biosynthesis protein
VILVEICVSIPKLIALYLPQFHPIPQNDEWWGCGFTEWTNVVAARPHFRGHYQPHIPADLGFYDLRLSETREAQAALARRYGIHGFCYYHYWFNGTQLLERPFNDVLSSRKPDLPFCLCWANESWTRTWDGLERRILKKQDYSSEDNRRHIDWLLRAFQDDRYICIEGKPLFIFYRLLDIPNAGEMLDMWRTEARRKGMTGLYLCAMQTGITESPDADLLRLGVDAIVDFQPNWKSFPVSGNFINRLAVVAKRVLPSAIYQALGRSVSAERVIDYGKVVDTNVVRSWPEDYTKFPCVFPSWDNSARRKSATIIQNDDPAKYQEWLEASIAAVRRYDAERQVVFINAWNEWAEGCHLEPDRKNQYSFLTATTNALAVGDRARATSGPVR